MPLKIGVDPDPSANADFVMCSDEYFENFCDRLFDIVFIDGLHEASQVERDILNALYRLEPGGCIVLHDMNPPDAMSAREVYEVEGKFPSWCGTSWQGFARLRATRPDLEMYVVDTDWGCGFVRPGRQRVYSGPRATYDDLDSNRHELLNLISVREFLQRHPARRRSWSPLDRFLA